MEDLTPNEQGFLDELSVASGNSPEPETPEPEDTDTQPAEEPEQQPEPEAEEPSIEDILNGTQGGQQKANQAFAEMRVKNKQMAATIGKLAEALGFNPNSTEEELLAGINDILTQQQAQQQQVPVEILQRLNELEAVNNAYRQDQMRAQAQRGLSALRDKYAIEQDDMVAFVEDLNNAGLNPLYNPNVNLEAEFLSRNFEKIISKKVEAAVQEEQARAAKAQEHSSTPSKTSGAAKQDAPKEQINTVKALDAFFRDVDI